MQHINISLTFVLNKMIKHADINFFFHLIQQFENFLLYFFKLQFHKKIYIHKMFYLNYRNQNT